MKIHLSVVSIIAGSVLAFEIDQNDKYVPMPAPVAAATNPVVPTTIKDDGFGAIEKSQKKKLLVSRASGVEGFPRVSMFFKKLASRLFEPMGRTLASFALSSKAWKSDEAQEPFYDSGRTYYSSSTPINNTDPNLIQFSSTTDRLGAAETQSTFRSQNELSKKFSKKFDNMRIHVPHPQQFVKAGIKNAKKHLISNTRLAKAFASSAMEKAMDVYDNTARSFVLLKSLVEQGVITPQSAAQELAQSIGNKGKKLLSLGQKKIEDATEYLLNTSTDSVDGIINGLQHSPTAIKELKMKYPSVFKGYAKSLDDMYGRSTRKMRQDNKHLKEWLFPRPTPELGAIWKKYGRSIKKVKTQWQSIGGSFTPETKQYKEAFVNTTDELARIMDVLSVRLGKTVMFEVPGIDLLKKKFQQVIEEIKNKNSLAISGSFSIKDLLQYTMGATGQLKALDRVIIQLIPVITPGGGSLSFGPFGMVKGIAENEHKQIHGDRSQPFANPEVLE